MALSQALLPEFDQEMSNTRKTLERIPEEKFEWKPHEKSFAMGALATHVATLPTWTTTIIDTESMDIRPDGAPPPKAEPVKSREELLAKFDGSIAAARASLAGASDQDLVKPWSLLAAGKTVFTIPRIAAIRSFVMNHNVHHRAQLGVYLRLNDIPVPSIYGPSADEGAF
jgi:uncharacterized damage-inducible protein DinB